MKNLYNDPDKNGEDPHLHVEIKPPGKTDWTFNLEVAGKEAIASPGVHAVTKIVRH